MPDDYQIPAMALIAALMLAIVYLHSRSRSVRTLLWILALGCAEIQGILLWMISNWAATGIRLHPHIIGMNVVGESALMLSSALFLASLSPLSFQVGRVRILYAVPYIIPILLYSLLYYGVSQHPTGRLQWFYCFLAVWAIGVAFAWSLQMRAMPIWLASVIAIFAFGATVLFFVHGNAYFPLLGVQSANMFIAAVLVVYTFPRSSPGVMLATLGFIGWALPPFFLMHFTPQPLDASPSSLILARVAILGKVAVAMGLILLVLEDEVESNQTAQQRERRVRLELEAYARQALTARNLEEFDSDSSHLCEMIVEHSLFEGSAIVVRNASGAYTLVGYAGMDGAAAGALDALAQRLPLTCFATEGTSLVADGKSLDLDLSPWLTPGDDLERLRLTRVGAVPMLGPDNAAEGAILLTGLRAPLQVLRADDLLPLEILAGRLQAARAQALMLGKLIDSERFAGVGQLATNIAQQLNNPLTVILGYSALLEDSAPQSAEHRGAEAISSEARRMKGILERLSRFSRLSTERFNSFSVVDLITDIEQMHRPDFLRHSIEFRLTVGPDIPPIFGNAHQIRQALMHATQYAIDSVLRVGANQEKSVRIDAACPSSETGRVLITIAHSGQGFLHPDRAFDSLSSAFSGTESTGIGLSLCAAIIREHRGNITAVNYKPTGAAILLDLPVS
jgi:signal transduction histidine kinase